MASRIPCPQCKTVIDWFESERQICPSCQNVFRDDEFRCPLCNVRPIRISDGVDSWTIKCVRCGDFSIDEAAWDSIKDSGPAYLAAGLLREARERGEAPEKVTVELLEVARQWAPRSPVEIADRLLKKLVQKSHYFGDIVELNLREDFSLAYARNDQELRSCLEHLKETKLIKSISFDDSKVSVTAEGFRRVDEASRRGLEAGKAFIAMSFDLELREAFEGGIVPGVRDAGYLPVRLDFLEHAGNIDDRMMAEIRESRFVVADFTHHRNGVYFESGFALGLGLPVIWTCRKDHLEQAHFDTSHFNHLEWTTPEDLREKLAVRIRAVVGLGPHRGSDEHRTS
jgi:hypothetical protein